MGEPKVRKKPAKGRRTQRRKIDWGSVPLGELPVREIADMLGSTVASVMWAHKARGIPIKRVYQRVDWDTVPFGSAPPAALAEMLGVSLNTVYRTMRKRGISEGRKWCKPPPKREGDTLWDDLPLGKMTV